MCSWERPVEFVLFGDSLTQGGFDEGGGTGWVGYLASRYVRRADIVNRGFSGYTTRWALQFFDRMVETGAIRNDPGLVVIFLGANDAAKEVSVQHVDIDEYEHNLVLLVHKFRGCGAKRIILVTPPPLDDEAWHSYMKKRALGQNKPTPEKDREIEVTERYAHRCKAVASRLGLSCTDLWPSLSKLQSSDGERYFSDGLHFTAEGNRVVFEELIKTIETDFPELKITPCEFSGKYDNSGSSCKGLLPHGPWWDHIDPTNGLKDLLKSKANEG